MAYLPLSTANLPDPVIDPAQGSSPEDYFNTVLYTGDGSNGKSIAGVGFQTDFNWTKSRSSGSYSHQLSDVVRDFTHYLYSNATNAEGTDASNHIQSVNSDGYVINSGASFNASGVTYVSWNWKANGSGVSNTDGSITSTVSANTTSGFSIVSYTGTNVDGATVGHGLDQAVELVIVKNRDSTAGANSQNWGVAYYANNTASYLNETNDFNAGRFSAMWGSLVDSSTFVVDTDGGSYGITQSNGDDHIAYCFHSVEGFSKFGSYTGNGSTDGSFVFCGFRPAFVMVKRTDASNNWVMLDSERDTYNVANASLLADRELAETDYGIDFDFLSNGFKLRSGNTPENASGGTYIFMAFSDANGPFKYSNAR